jgi:hypothetical protein
MSLDQVEDDPSEEKNQNRTILYSRTRFAFIIYIQDREVEVSIGK